MAKADTYARAVEVHRLLKAREVINSTVVAARFEISPRHAQRVIDFLAQQLRAPLAFDYHRRTYYYLEPTFELPTRIMTEGEAVAIIIAHQALMMQQATPLGSRLLGAINTLKDLLPETVSVGASDLLQNVSFEPSPTRRIEAHVLDTLVGAVEKRKTVRILYYAVHSDETSERDVDVYHLTNRRGDWYAVGYCHMRRGMRTFAVSRMRTVEVLHGEFVLPPDFDANDYFSQSMGVYNAERADDVVLEFDSYESRWVGERVWHSSQRTERLDNGCLRVTLTVRPDPEMMHWIMAYGPHVRVVSPATLAQQIARLHRAAFEQYVSSEVPPISARAE